MLPEIIRGCDLILFQPFLDMEDLAIIRAIRKADMPPAPKGTPPEAADLLKRIWWVLLALFVVLSGHLSPYFY